MHKAVSALRANLREAQQRYRVGKSYNAAVDVQRAARELAEFFKAERKAFAVIDGGGQTTPFKPGQFWRIIDGQSQVLYPT